MASISIFGGGAWGRALAFAFGEAGNAVSIVSRKELSNLPKGVVQRDLEDAKKADFFVIAIATFALRDWLKKAKLSADAKILFASKGIEILQGLDSALNLSADLSVDSTLKTAPGADLSANQNVKLSENLSHNLSENLANDSTSTQSAKPSFVSDIAESFNLKNTCYLCGPSFAAEVAKALPAALVLYSKNAALAREFAALFPGFVKTYTGGDVLGGEIAGAYKNVIAIAGGACDGLNLGNNAKAALLARGLVEMCRFGAVFGAETATFLGLAGAGDLFLSANSTMSRNYRVGLGFAQNRPLGAILSDLGEVAEGVLTSLAIAKIAKMRGIHTPIANQVALLCSGQTTAKKSVEELLRRD